MPKPHHKARWVAFYSVGGLGVLVQLATLAILTGPVGLGYLPSTALAVEVAILHNFLWHERWTWADPATPLAGGVGRRLVRFNITNGLLSILGNVAFTALFVALLGTNYVVSNVLAIAVCSVLNFLAADRLVFVPEV